MAVTLPTWPGPRSASLTPVDAGSWQVGSMGGDAVRLDRLGDRFRLAVTLPPMKWHTIDGVSAARIWTARLNRGISEGVIMEVPQPDFDTTPLPVGTSMGPDLAAQRVTITVGALAPGLVIPEGVMVTYFQAATGRNFLHQVRSQAIANGAGEADVALWPRTRIVTAALDQLRFRTPVIEGRLVNAVPVDLDEVRFAGISFEIEENR